VQLPDQEPWASGREVVAVLRRAGFETYVAGGCVRDLLLGRPVNDIDVASAAHPPQVEATFAAHGWRTVAVGRAFGVVVVVTPDGRHVEVATFRSDGAYVDGRRPAEVTFTTAAEDVARRDFTINALLLDPVDGRVIDHVGGVADLGRRLVRAVGDPLRRFGEDRLRVLRALRFAAVLDFTIEEGTWNALAATTLAGLSGERIVQEWFKALSGAGRDRWLGLLARSGQLGRFCPPLGGLTDGQRAVHGQRLERLAPDDAQALQAALWLAPADPQVADAWLAGLPLARDLLTTTRWLLAHGRAPAALAARPRAERRRLWQHPAGPQLARLLALAHGAAADALVAEQAAEAAAGPWRPWLRAADLMALGCPPGPALGRLLRAVEDVQLDGRLADREAALALARELLAKG
jgi:poly(A) polymerase